MANVCMISLLQQLPEATQQYSPMKALDIDRQNQVSDFFEAKLMWAIQCVAVERSLSQHNLGESGKNSTISSPHSNDLSHCRLWTDFRGVNNLNGILFVHRLYELFGNVSYKFCNIHYPSKLAQIWPLWLHGFVSYLKAEGQSSWQCRVRLPFQLGVLDPCRGLLSTRCALLEDVTGASPGTPRPGAAPRSAVATRVPCALNLLLGKLGSCAVRWPGTPRLLAEEMLRCLTGGSTSIVPSFSD